jgi:glycosyltransferase involved in cell wall biosynthesis
VRRRILAYRQLLESNGWGVDVDSIVSTRLFEMKNEAGWAARIEKSVRLGWGLVKRAAVLLMVRRYDAVWIHREAFPFFTPWPERLVRRLARGRVVLDFDDALYEAPPGGRDWRSPLRRPEAFRGAVASADIVLAGSPVLAEWAHSAGATTRLVPTCIAIPSQAVERTSAGAPTIGWIGSWSTTPSLIDIVPALRSVRQETGARILLIGADNLRSLAGMLPGAEWRRWSLDREDADLAEFDIGIMPLADTPWNQGKCAYKVIQYMAHGIPFVASPVGMNRTIAIDSQAGLLASARHEWLDALRNLVRDTPTRERLGTAGRDYAINHFDASAFESEILDALAG